MIRALIIDDEPHARRELEQLLRKTGFFEVVGQCANAVEGVKAINGQRPDAIFLDIQMPVINGFEMLSMIDRELLPLVVFVTAYDEFAIKAFEERALDYLLKPVRPERLALTVEKLQERIKVSSRPDYKIEPLSRIPCLRAGNIKLVPVEQVEYALVGLSGVSVAVGGEQYNTDLTLKALEQRTELFRCHRKCLVNLALIDQIIPGDGGAAAIRTTSGALLQVSRRHLKDVKKQLGI